MARGNKERGLRDRLRALELVESKYDPWQRLGSLAGLAAIHVELGQLDEARTLALQVPPLVREIGLHGALSRLGPYAEMLSIRDDLREAMAAGAGPRVPWWRALIEQILADELGAAADSMASAGTPTIEANLRKHAGLRLLAAGHTADAKIELGRALAFYRSVPRRATSRRSRARSPKLRASRRSSGRTGRSSGDVVDDLVDLVAARDQVVEIAVITSCAFSCSGAACGPRYTRSNMKARSDSIASPTSGVCRTSSTPSEATTMSWTSVSIRAEPVPPRIAISSRGRSLSREEPVAHRVVDVVVDVRDPVDEPHDLPLERVGLALTGVREDPVADLAREVERLRDAQGLLVVPEATAESELHGFVERVFTRMAERRVPHVVAEPDRLGEVLVQPQRSCDDTRDRRRLERVGHARAVVVALGVDEDLRLPLQPSERLRVHDAVAVALERGPHAALLLRAFTTPGLERAHRERRQALLERLDPLLERRLPAVGDSHGVVTVGSA